ncbi:hypothetical protein BKA69DRAFT_284807 [Paraphysoderma sedebokerense]|nr:hypothetical protein BKA69DRAFT_284807 [Paraphysoderma sedebokerense]
MISIITPSRIYAHRPVAIRSRDGIEQWRTKSQSSAEADMQPLRYSPFVGPNHLQTNSRVTDRWLEIFDDLNRQAIELSNSEIDKENAVILLQKAVLHEAVNSVRPSTSASTPVFIRDSPLDRLIGTLTQSWDDQAKLDELRNAVDSCVCLSQDGRKLEYNDAKTDRWLEIFDELNRHFIELPNSEVDKKNAVILQQKAVLNEAVDSFRSTLTSIQTFTRGLAPFFTIPSDFLLKNFLFDSSRDQIIGMLKPSWDDQTKLDNFRNVVDSCVWLSQESKDDIIENNKGRFLSVAKYMGGGDVFGIYSQLQ